MPQKLIDVKIEDPAYRLEELEDVLLNNKQQWDVIVYNNLADNWVNLSLEYLFGQVTYTTILKTSSFTAGFNYQYIVDVSSNPITASLPIAPPMGVTVLFCDRWSPTLGGNCKIGFETNNFTIKAPTGYKLEGKQELVLHEDGAIIRLIYVGCETWRILFSNVTTLQPHRAIVPKRMVGGYTLAEEDWEGLILFEPPITGADIQIGLLPIMPDGYWCEVEMIQGTAKFVGAGLDGSGTRLVQPYTTIRLVYSEVYGWHASGPLVD